MNLSATLANFSFLILFISTLVYWIDSSNLFFYSTFSTQNKPPLDRSRDEVNQTDVKIGVFDLLQSNLLNFGNIGIVLSNISLFLLLCIRWLESGHFPLSNLYESLIFLSWALTLLHLIINFDLFLTFKSIPIINFSIPLNFNLKFEGVRTFPEREQLVSPSNNPERGFVPPLSLGLPGTGGESRDRLKSKKNEDILGNETEDKKREEIKFGANLFYNKKKIFLKLVSSIIAPSALFTNAFASFSLPTDMQNSGPLVPALQSNWLMMHVTVMVLSYAALIVGSLLSIGFLVISGVKNQSNSSLLKIKKEVLGSPSTSERAQGVFVFGTKNIKGTGKEGNPEKDGINDQKETGEMSTKLDLAKILDNLSYRILGFGFPLLTIGILSGAVWANEAWGSYWSWDPKETWALLTWLIFAIYLHTRLNKGWEGKKPALIASFGFIIVWICFLGVNLLGEGLHSYGWLNKN